MNELSRCRGAAELQELVSRPLSDEEAEALGRHLDRCEGCASTVDALLSGDTYATALRSRGSMALAPLSNQAHALIARLDALRAYAEDVTVAPVTPASAGTPTPGPHPALPRPGTPLTFLAPARGPDELGWLGSFRILRELGAGGMGMVFLAEDTKLQRRVALKVMRPELCRPEQRERFLREARAAAAVTHDHIVTIYQVGEEGEVPFLAMQLLEGESLDDWLKGGQSATPLVACRIGREIAEGLAAAHSRGLIHRDIKPGNVWLERLSEPEASAKRAATLAHASGSVGRVKILDFGLARAAAPAAGEQHLTASGAIVGTPAYAAPEQFRGVAEERSDLFSLGVVLYRLLTGKMPFKGDDLLSIVASVSLDSAAPVCSINRDVSQELSDFVMQLLDKEPKDRPATARDVADRLVAIEQSLRKPVAVDQTIAIGGPGALATAGSRKSLPATPIANALGSPRRGRPILIAAALAASLLLIAGVWVIIRDKNGKEVGRLKVPDGGSAVVQGDGAIGDVKSPFPPLDPDWIKKVQALPAEGQVKEVAAEMKRRNPGFDGKVDPMVSDGQVAWLTFCTDALTDLTPVRALPKLIILRCAGSAMGKGKLADLSALSGLKLEGLNVDNNHITDLSPLRGMRLRELWVSGGPLKVITALKGMTSLAALGVADSEVADLSPLAGIPLNGLAFFRTLVSDLSPLTGMPLQTINFGGTRVVDLTPLKGMPIRAIACRELFPDDVAILKSFKHVQTINGEPAAEVLAGLVKAAFPPLDPAWVKRVQALAPDDQTKEVAAELKRRNPGFDGLIKPEISNEAVAVVNLCTDAVTDLTPVRALPSLVGLRCEGSARGKGRLADLSPLVGIKLFGLVVAHNRVTDLSPLRGMPLRELTCRGCPLKDLSPLKGMPNLSGLCLDETEVVDLTPLASMPLTSVAFCATPVWDLSPLKGMPLRNFNCGGSRVSDLSPLKGMRLEMAGYYADGVVDLSPLLGMPLRHIHCRPPVLDDVEFLKSFKILETINGKPAAEVLEGLVKAPPFPPLDPAWLKKVQALAPDDQTKEVAAELKRRNPGFDGQIIKSENWGTEVAVLQFCTDAVTDLTPVRALGHLVNLSCMGSAPGKGRLTDLSPLSGLKIALINVAYNRVTDLTPLRGMPQLKSLNCFGRNRLSAMRRC